MANLIEITTSRQLKNGTRMFKCQRTKSLYGSYKSGFIRRIPYCESYGFKMATRLNKTTKIKTDSGWEKTEFTRIKKEIDRLNLIISRSDSYKGYRG